MWAIFPKYTTSNWLRHIQFSIQYLAIRFIRKSLHISIHIQNGPLNRKGIAKKKIPPFLMILFSFSSLYLAVIFIYFLFAYFCKRKRAWKYIFLKKKNHRKKYIEWCSVFLKRILNSTEKITKMAKHFVKRGTSTINSCQFTQQQQFKKNVDKKAKKVRLLSIY